MTRPPAPGPRNLLTDVPGLAVGNAEDEAARTGVTVILPDAFARAAVDVRGGGPGTRETEALSPENQVGGVHAIALSGGSALGLGAADAVAAALSASGRGLAVHPEHPPVPIVPAAILYDLGPHSAAAFAAEGGPPHPRLARAALAAAGADFALGSVGAGRGANAGALKGGLGSVSLILPGFGADGGPVAVAALVAANPVGAVTLPGSRAFWAWPFEMTHDGRPEFGGLRPAPDWRPSAEPFPAESRFAGPTPPPGAATAIGVVATDADLTTAECLRLAMMAQDGYARAIRPAHSPMDGDTVFALATARARLGEGRGRLRALAALGAAAADCVARAVARAAYEATSGPGERPAWRDPG
ncbi:MAG: P1 family peptidase [Pseudomonadota bacterium]|nr:P1 family peptidase [Pseudomonadota bacterium]